MHVQSDISSSGAAPATQDIPTIARQGVQDYRSLESLDLIFYDESLSGGKYNEEDYMNSLFQASAEILKGYDFNQDGEVAEKEFIDGVFQEYGLDMVGFLFRNKEEIEDANQAALGAYRMADMLGNSIDLDCNSQISVEEMAVLLQYVDANGWHQTESGNYVKDDNGFGEISYPALSDLLDWLTDGGNQNIEAAQKYRRGEEMTNDDDEFLDVQYMMAKNLLALRQQGENYGIGYTGTSKYTDFE